MEMGRRKRMTRAGITSVALGRARLERLDGVLALRGCSRSALLRELVDAVLAKYERVQVEDGDAAMA